jgi:hypothetical protein
VNDPQKTIETLRRFNQWRRGDESIEQPDPTEIGVAIDDAIKCIEQRDMLAKALRKIDKGDMLGWCGQVAHKALAAVKGGRA